jgi:hypothetical protein
LASFQVGNVIPAWTDLRVFAGHGPETLNSAEKQANIRRFFDPETDDLWRRSLLQEFEVDYVFYGPQEQELGDWDPALAAFLELAYQEMPYTIHRVEMEP